MTMNLSIAASGLRHQQARLRGAAHNIANQAAVPPSATVKLRTHAIEVEGGAGVESRTDAQRAPDDAIKPGGDLLSTGILPLLTAPNHAKGLAQVIRAQDEMTGILLDITA